MCGDGGFTMLMGELLTAAEFDLPVKLMIFNNSTRGMVRAEMEVAGYVPWGTDVKNPNFGAVAQAVGIHGERVETPGDIEPAIQRALEHKGPALVDFVTDPRALSMPPKVTFEQVRGYALAMGKLVFGFDVPSCQFPCVADREGIHASFSGKIWSVFQYRESDTLD